MSRDERPTRLESASELEPAGPARVGSGFDSTNDIESIHVGCSMLARIRFRPRNSAALAPMRCHLGYALHSSEEVAKCLAVEGPNECWKIAPSWRVPGMEQRSGKVAAVPEVSELPVLTNDQVELEHAGPNGVTPVDDAMTQVVEIAVVELAEVPTRPGTDHGGVE